MFFNEHSNKVYKIRSHLKIKNHLNINNYMLDNKQHKNNLL